MDTHSELMLGDGHLHGRYGGISRKEAVTITSASSPDAQVDMKRSMDALTLAVAPLYDSLSMQKTVGNKAETLTNVNFLTLP